MQDHWQMCYYFSLGYMLVMWEEDSDYLFPDFGRKVAVANANSKQDSQVSKYWTQRFTEELTYYTEQYTPELRENDTALGYINPKLSVHCGKKRGINEMGSSDLASLPMIFRGGWEMRNVHTLFDYIHKQEKLDAAKTIAGWKQKYNGNIFGGYPPCLNDISEEKRKVRRE